MRDEPLFFFILGCGEDTEQREPEDPRPPEVVNVSVKNGAAIPGNASITVTFNKKMKSAKISIHGASGTIFFDPSRKTAMWTPSRNIPPGENMLTVTGIDMLGQRLEGFEPIRFTAAEG